MEILPSAAFWTSRRAGCAILGLLVLVFFGDLLLGSGDRVVSSLGTDIFRQFAGWRFFGFDQIRNGNFPLWTPMVYGGMPYFSGFQSALLYPPNWIFALLPLGHAINWSVALHVWWLGCGMYLWTRCQGLRQIPALFSGALMMFCAPHFLHIYAGHLSNLCVMAWMPWFFMIIDLWRERGRVMWVLAGGAIVAMQILAGHPQYVYYGGIVSTVYALLQLFRISVGKVKFLVGFAGMFGLACLLAAVQLLPGIEAAGESIRSGGTGKVFAGSYSFPPENLITMLVPAFFGDMVKTDYWGRWFYWEMSAFFSVAGVWCAVAGIVWGKRGRRREGGHAGLMAVAAGCAVLLAFGSYTPLFDLMYAAVPGFDMFRGNSKFIFFAVMFLIALSGMGLDRLWEQKRLPRENLFFGAGLAVALAFVVLGFLLGSDGGDEKGGLWENIREAMWSTGQVTHLSTEIFQSKEFIRASADAAARGLWVAAASIVLAFLLTRNRGRSNMFLLGIAALGTLEAAVFASKYRESFQLGQLLPGLQIEFRRQNLGDFRVVDTTRTNSGMLSALPDLWGDDPGVLARYAEFMAASQGVHPDQASQHVKLKQISDRWSLLRFGYAFTVNEDRVQAVKAPVPPLRQFELIPGYEIRDSRDGVFARVFAEGFDPRAVVVLEEAPAIAMSIAPGQGAVEGSWRIERQDTDEVVVDVQVDRPCVLLMTDVYSEGWKVEAAAAAGDRAPQERYQLLPANYILRAIPLEAGHHVLRIYFEPATLIPAAAVSAVSWIGACGVLVLCLRRKRRE